MLSRHRSKDTQYDNIARVFDKSKFDDNTLYGRCDVVSVSGEGSPEINLFTEDVKSSRSMNNAVGVSLLS